MITRFKYITVIFVSASNFALDFGTALFKMYVICNHHWTYMFILWGSASPGGRSHLLSVRSEPTAWMLYTEPRTYCTFMLLWFHFTGDSLFSSFFPLERSPFFFLFAKSWGSLGSSGRLAPLVGLRGLMVPGRRGRTIGDGARTGVGMLLAVSVVSEVTWGDKWWGGVGAGGHLWQFKQHFHSSKLSCSISVLHKSKWKTQVYAKGLAENRAKTK